MAAPFPPRAPPRPATAHAAPDTGARCWGRLVLVILLLHYAWEMVQGPLYMNFSNVRWVEHALPCARAALGDVTLAALAYAVPAALTRRWRWPFERNRIAPALLWLVVGLALTTLIERWALSRGRWGYTEQMPLLLGVGLAPLLQWTVLPPLSLLLTCRRPR